MYVKKDVGALPNGKYHRHPKGDVRHKDTIHYINQKKNIESIPKNLPLFIVSGEKDPVGGWGAGPARLYETYKKRGFTDVRLRLYADDRHEILNETDRQAVYKELAGWLLEKTAAQKRI